MAIINLKQALKKQGKTQAGLAGALGRNKSAVTLLLQGKRQLKASEIPLIAQYLGISEAELLGMPNEPVAEPRIIIKEVVKEVVKQADSPPQEALHIPLAGTVSEALLASGNVVRRQNAYFYQGAPAPDAGCFMLEVTDLSLNQSGLLPGDLALCHPHKRPKKNDIVLVKHVLDTGEELGLLRQYRPPFLESHSSISGFDRLHEERANVSIIATVVQIIRHYS